MERTVGVILAESNPVEQLWVYEKAQRKRDCCEANGRRNKTKRKNDRECNRISFASVVD